MNLTTQQKAGLRRHLKRLALKVKHKAYLSPEDIEDALNHKIARINVSAYGYELTDIGRGYL